MRLSLALWMTLAWLIGCAGPTQGVERDGPGQEKETAMPSAVQLSFVELKPGKPPLVTVLLDVTLRNERAEARWFLLPAWLEDSDHLLRGGVDGVETYGPRGRGRVVVGRFYGSGGFQAVLVPAQATVKLRRFPVKFWAEEMPDGPVPVAVVIASQVTVGGEPAQNWLGPNALAEAQADVVVENAEPLGSRFTPDRHELDLVVVEEQRLQIPVDIRAKK